MRGQLYLSPLVSGLGVSHLLHGGLHCLHICCGTNRSLVAVDVQLDWKIAKYQTVQKTGGLVTVISI